jgi:flagellar hook-basal body complex protein FliE
MTIPIRPDGPIVSQLERGIGQSLETGSTNGPSFADTLTKAVNDVQGLQEDSANIIGAFVRGEPVELHQVMAASEEASLSLEFLVEMRNKLTDAYRSVMNMQT